jgi:hypothetical protein
MSTTRLPLFIDSAHREAAIKRHPRLWKKFMALGEEQKALPADDLQAFYDLEDERDEILRKMGLD